MSTKHSNLFRSFPPRKNYVLFSCSEDGSAIPVCGIKARTLDDAARRLGGELLSVPTQSPDNGPPPVLPPVRWSAFQFTIPPTLAAQRIAKRTRARVLDLIGALYNPGGLLVGEIPFV